MIDLKTYLELSKENNENPLVIEYNKKLIEDYPFLLPKNCFTGKEVEGYDYTWTDLDNMPNGWRIAFGNQMCKEIKDALIRANYLDEYRITQIKEKWGRLCWYDNGAPHEVYDIISKYEKLSEDTCIDCGAQNVQLYETNGWISFICKDCAEKRVEFAKAHGIDTTFEKFCYPIKTREEEENDRARIL